MPVQPVNFTPGGTFHPQLVLSAVLKVNISKTKLNFNFAFTLITFSHIPAGRNIFTKQNEIAIVVKSFVEALRLKMSAISKKTPTLFVNQSKFIGEVASIK